MSSLIDPDNRRFTWHDVSYRAKSAFAVLLSLVVLVGGAWFVYDKAHAAWQDFRQQDDYVGEGTDEVVVTVPRGATTYRISDILVTNDVIKTAKAFDVAAAKNPKAGTIQAGRYKLRKHLPAEAALQMMLDPANIIRTKVRTLEGARVSAVLAQLAKPESEGGTGIAATEYEKAIAEHGADLGLPEYAKNDPEGYLFPDTYSFATDGTALSVLQQMVAQYNAVQGELSLDARAQQAGIAPNEIVTVASIVENEVRREQDRPRVARVIYNRIKAGMPLQMDSTVHYAVGKDGSVTTTDEERKNPSPYNTYVHPGLPPGPIGSPGKASLAAALAPEAGNWLYFVTVDLDTGETVFASTLDEHEQNRAKFQAWCQAHPGRC